MRFEIVDASAKVRNGGAKDAQGDLDLPHWAGVVPLHKRYGEAIAEPDLAPGVALPGSVRALLTMEESA